MYLEFRLGDLGAIDKKYDVAVSTACSSLNTVPLDHAVELERELTDCVVVYCRIFSVRGTLQRSICRLNIHPSYLLC